MHFDSGVSNRTKPHWYAPTPAKFLVAVLLMQGVFFLSTHYRWFWFNEFKGGTALIAVVSTVVALVLLIGCVAIGWFLKVRAQFHLATLLLMVLVVAIPWGWLANDIARADRQRKFVASIKETKWREGIVAYTGKHPYALFPTFMRPWGPAWLMGTFGEDHFFEVDHVAFSGARDADLVAIGNFKQLRQLRLPGSSITDAGLVHVQGLSQLEWSELQHSRITDDGLQSLAGLTRLSELNLNGTEVGDAGMNRLKHLTQLRHLSLEFTNVGDVGLEFLPSFGQLESLFVNGTQITDEQLTRLRDLKCLKKLSLEHTAITDAGLDHIKECTSLRQLRTDGSKVTPRGRTILRNTRPDIQQE